ncbi:2-hydroxychromene-2-carboxylate isomerase [Ancylobacter terrae]|uniref:2-hydroxychromene-2-carboxylate isomerase n=1 Tax=Ancylobacter sp. sgz301288 TaxID=3342077 RepID=UPI00385E62FD
MARTIDYYFSVVSPWAALGHQPFMDVVRRHGVTVRYLPVALGEVFAETGGLPLAKRHPARQRYRLLELKRWRVRRGVPDFQLQPPYWPFNPALADRIVIAAVDAGHDPDRLLARVFAGVWREGRDLADVATLRAILGEVGLPADLVQAAEGDAVVATYRGNRERAVGAEVFGSPAYVLDGEVFWGQDRIDLLDDALSSGRAPYTPAT